MGSEPLGRGGSSQDQSQSRPRRGHEHTQPPAHAATSTHGQPLQERPTPSLPASRSGPRMPAALEDTRSCSPHVWGRGGERKCGHCLLPGQPCAFSPGHVRPCWCGFWKGSAGGRKWNGDRRGLLSVQRFKATGGREDKTDVDSTNHTVLSVGSLRGHLLAESASHLLAHSSPGRPRAPSSPPTPGTQPWPGLTQTRKDFQPAVGSVLSPKGNVQASPGRCKTRSCR